MFILARYLKNYKKEVIFGPVFKLIEAIFELITPLLMAKIIDVGVKNSDIGYVLKMGGLILLLGAIGLCCAIVCQYYASVASQGFGTVVRNELFKHINTLSHSELDNLGTSSLITRMTNDINQLQLAVAMLIRLVVRAPFLAIGAIIMAMILDFKLSIIFLVATPLIVLVLYLITWKSIPYFRSIQKKLDKISLLSEENLEGARVIRAFSKQDMKQKAFEEASEDLSKTAIRVGKLSSMLNPLTFIIVNFAIIAILWFGGGRVENGFVMQGDIIAFVNYMTQTLLAFIVVINLVVIFTKASASADRVNEVFSTSPSVVETNASDVEPKGNCPKIEFKDVSFSYNASEKYSLKNISVKIDKGETFGIIGGTGSGKSTFANLISRFYDVTKGQILIDGTDVKDFSFTQLRGQIGLVPQTAALFSGTIKENLSWGFENLSNSQMIKALDIAQASEFVEKLPYEYETVISQGGQNLSGGQKQRLTIARAIAKNPEILILDDSASALDYVTDLKLRQAINSETKDVTVILISQRVSTIKNADNILVLDNGEIVGLGSHDELLKTCNLYNEIFKSQTENSDEKTNS